MVQAQVRPQEHSGEDRLGSQRKRGKEAKLDTPLNDADVVEILGKAHERETLKTIESLDESGEVSSGAELLKRAEMHGINREELQRAIAERIREKKASKPLSSTREYDKEQLKLDENASIADVIREKTVRKQVDPLIRGLTDHLKELADKGLDKGVTAKEIWLDKDTLRMEVPEWVTCRYADEKFRWAAAVSLGLTAVSSFAAACTKPADSNFYYFFIIGACLGCAVPLVLLPSEEEPARKIDLTKPTNSPAMNDLFAFCKNNGISAQIFTEGETQFLGFKM